MNAKKCKALRKVCRNLPVGDLPDLPHYRRVGYDFTGEPYVYFVTKPMVWPEGTRRRVYQDAKKYW